MPHSNFKQRATESRKVSLWPNLQMRIRKRYEHEALNAS